MTFAAPSRPTGRRGRRSAPYVRAVAENATRAADVRIFVDKISSGGAPEAQGRWPETGREGARGVWLLRDRRANLWG